MPSMRPPRKTAFARAAIAILWIACPRCKAQAALLMEEPYGFFGAINPTGHTAVYFERICAETPVKLRRYARKRPETALEVFEIPQIPGYRPMSRHNKNIDESQVTTAYAIPIALANPYLAGGLFVDYLVRGRYHLIPRDPVVLQPDDSSALTAPARLNENRASDGAQVPGAGSGSSAQTQISKTESGLKGTGAADE